MNVYRIEEYEQYFEEFNPVDFNPREWAKMAREEGCGMRF